MLSQFMTNDKHQRNKKFLGELFNFPEGSMAVGRLDELSEGLLLITTDGQLSHHINKSGLVDKEYIVQVDGVVSKEAIKEIENGVSISINGNNYDTKPCKANLLERNPVLPTTVQKIRDDRHGPTSWLSITLKEGKFRQVRKMTGVVGHPTLRLARTRIGSFNISTMKGKNVIEINDEIIRELFFNDN